jgi:hypothetical protein
MDIADAIRSAERSFPQVTHDNDHYFLLAHNTGVVQSTEVLKNRLSGHAVK